MEKEQRNFIREGARSENKKGWKSSVLNRGDWELRADLNRWHVFSETVDTPLKPDIELRSKQSKMLVDI